MSGGAHWRVGWSGDLAALTDDELAERRTSMAEEVMECLADASVEGGPDEFRRHTIEIGFDAAYEADAVVMAREAWMEAEAEAKRRARFEPEGGGPSE